MKCLKCQNEIFDKKIISAKPLDIESKYLDRYDLFQVNVCNNCGLTQWYDDYVISGRKKNKRNYEKSPYPLPERKNFVCLNCVSHECTVERVVTAGKGVTNFLVFVNPGIWGQEWYGEILLQICNNCGLVESHEILLNIPLQHYAIRARDKMMKITKEFECPVCKSGSVLQAGVVSFLEKYENSANQSRSAHPFVTCKQCKYMQIFDELKL
ncbi:MAG: hypothetical protein H8D45_32245 [Bacteroidetes bacterium]|nr:hypothetical protein [Bacteroidota bacterium]